MQTFTTFLTLSLLISPLLASTIPIQQRAACSADVQKLVDGINSNIAVQKDEAAGAKILSTVLAADTIDMDDFTSAKATLLTNVNKGITIRTANQKITPADNKATAGLATVANAQKMELSLTKGLTADAEGVADVKTLMTAFAGGLKQNQQNAKDVSHIYAFDIYPRVLGLDRN